MGSDNSNRTESVAFDLVRMEGNEEEAKERIGDEYWDLIMKSVVNGTLNSQKMLDLAYGLGREVGGKHKGRIEAPREPSDRREMIKVFADWYSLDRGLATMSNEQAVKKLITLLRGRTIGLHPLANKLEKGTAGAGG